MYLNLTEVQSKTHQWCSKNLKSPCCRNVSVMWGEFCFACQMWRAERDSGGLQVWLPIVHLTPQQTRDSTTPAEHPVMRWKIFCRRRDGGEKSSAVMDRINKSGRSVITKLTQGVEEAREGGEGDGWNKSWRWTALSRLSEEGWERHHFHTFSCISLTVFTSLQVYFLLTLHLNVICPAQGPVPAPSLFKCKFKTKTQHFLLKLRLRLVYVMSRTSRVRVRDQRRPVVLWW